MDLSGDTTVSSYVAINTASKTAAPAEEFDLSITKIGDGTVTWSSSDPAIAEVQGAGLSAKVIAKKSGDATITANVAAAGNYQAGSAKCAVAVRVQNEAQLKAEIAAGNEAILAGNITLSEPLDLSGKTPIIRGEKSKPATITMGSETYITTNNGFTIQYVNFDATSLTKPFIQMADTTGTGVHNKVLFKGVDGYSNINQNAWIISNPVKIENCMIKNLSTQLYYANKYSWALDEFTLNDNIIQLANNTTAFIDMDGSSCAIFKNLNITNNTICNIIASSSSKFFIKGSNASNTQPKKIYGPDGVEGSYKWNISNNTMIKSWDKKDFANATPSISTVTITCKGNIFLDVYRLQKIFGNCKKDIDKTTNFIYGNEITIDNTDKSTYCTESDPGFTAPTAAIDLTKENGGLNLTPSGAAAAAGDPRWIK